MPRSHALQIIYSSKEPQTCFHCPKQKTYCYQILCFLFFFFFPSPGSVLRTEPGFHKEQNLEGSNHPKNPEGLVFLGSGKTFFLLLAFLDINGPEGVGNNKRPEKAGMGMRRATGMGLARADWSWS